MEGLGLLILTVLITARRACVAASGTLYVAWENQALVGHTFLSLHATSLVQCMVLCHRHRRCLSFNHGDTDGTCQMNGARAEENPASLQQKSGFLYFGGLESDTKGPMETTTETVQVSTDSQGQGDELDKSTAAMSTVLVFRSEDVPEVVIEPQPSPDFEAPTVTCPNSVWSYTNGGEAQPQPDWAPPTAVDNLDGEITCVDDQGIVVGPGDGFDKGVTTVRCELHVPDSVRNMGTCLFNVTIIDCGGCAPLGMEDGTIPDDQIGALNVLNSDDANYGPGLARLNGAKSWCAQTLQKVGDPLPWISVSLSHQADVYGVIVQGRPSSDIFVTNFIVLYRDGAWQEWSLITEDTGFLREFDSSKSGETAVHVPFQSALRDYIRLRLLRITPTKWQTAVCMRLEIIGKTAPFSVDG